MKRLFYLLILICALTFFNNYTFGQCDINADCAGNPILSIDPPIFDISDTSIVLNNIEVGEFACTAANYQSGVVIYIYQLLPNGGRMELCNVLNDAPFNVVGSVPIAFGQSSLCSGATLNLGSLQFGEDQGFIACDGAYLEIEAVLYITDNASFEPSSQSVYSALNTSEFISVNVGTLDININNEFPGGGLPVTTAVVNDFASGSDGPITVNCGEDVSLYVEGLSRIANCPPFTDLFTGIASELTNEFYYTVNGGPPVIVQSPAVTGSAGGQLTGPDPALNDLCYAGILTVQNPFLLLWSALPQDLCDGSTVEVTISTTDIFTGQTVSDQIEIIYSGGACGAPCNAPGCMDQCDPNYDPDATVDDPTLCAGYDDTCNADCTMGPFGGTWDAATCGCINETTSVNGCTDTAACNFDPTVNCEDNTLCIYATGCDVCDGNGGVTDNPEPGDACDDGDANTENDVIQPDCSCAGEIPGVAGCTDTNASNYDPAATEEDGSCLYLCSEDNLLDVSNNTGFDDGSGLSYGSPTGMGLLTGADNAFGGFIWNVNTTGLSADQICLFIDFEVTGDAAAFPITIEFRIENGDCGFFPCPWNDFNIVINGPGTYTLGGLASGGNVGGNGPFDPSGPNTYIVAAIANFSGTPLGGNIDILFNNLCVSNGNCIIEGCTDSTACNYDADATVDNGSCTVNDCEGVCGGPALPGTACTDANGNQSTYAADCSCSTLDVPGCTDATACNYNVDATVDDGSCAVNDCEGVCGGPALPGAACTDVNGNQSIYAADCSCPPTGIPGCTDPLGCNFDASATLDDGSCLFDDCEGNCGGNATAGTPCVDVNGNTSVYEADCSCPACEEEISGAIVTAEGCDVSGITISIIFPDATIINVVTGADGTFSVPGGPFPCGTYTAAFFDLDEIPACYEETGSTEPISFTLDGNENGNNDVAFFANPNVPTLSQWGLIVLALLLMCGGSVSLFQKRRESLT